MGDLILPILAVAFLVTLVSVMLSILWLTVEASRWVHGHRAAELKEAELKAAGVKLLKASARATDEAGRQMASGAGFQDIIRSFEKCTNPDCPIHGEQGRENV